jgi:hypothetical protein
MARLPWEYRDQPAGHEERRLTLEVDHLERLHVDLRGIEGDRLRGTRDHLPSHALEPRLVARAGGLGHLAAGVLLVSGARTRGVAVARADEAEAEAAPLARAVEVAEREPVLHRVARARRERACGSSPSRARSRTA